MPSLSRPLHYFNLPGSRIRPQGLHSSADFAGALARLKEGPALVPEDSRLLRMKAAVEKTIAGAEGLKGREVARQREESRSRAEAERFTTFLNMTGWSADTFTLSRNSSPPLSDRWPGFWLRKPHPEPLRSAAVPP